MTKVEEWTKADTGVGAAMAAGSHALNGSWALFVQAATMNTNAAQDLIVKLADCEGNSELLGSSHHLVSEIRIKASPTRFLIPVRRPELKALPLL